MTHREQWLTLLLVGVSLNANSGCDRQTTPADRNSAAATQKQTATSPATQAGTGELSAIQRMVAGFGGAGDDVAAKLPPGHPPVPGMPGRQPTPNSTAPPTRRPGDAENAAPPAAEAPPIPTPLKWEAPATWKETKPSTSFRLAQYEVPGIEGAGPGEVTVFHFPGTGGPVEDNIARWIGQFSNAEGKPLDPAGALRESFDVGGHPVHFVEVSGYMMVSRAMGGTGERSGGEYRLLGGIVEMPDGNWFFKGTGPEKTMAAAREAFRQMLRTVHE